MDFITERIAIGNSNDGTNIEELIRQGITAVLNVAFDLDLYYKTNSLKYGVEYNKVGLIDGPGNNSSTLVAAVFMLSQLLQRHDKVLVCCHAGVSRSTTVVALYLVLEEDMSLTEAYSYIKQNRSCCCPNEVLVDLAIFCFNVVEVSSRFKETKGKGDHSYDRQETQNFIREDR